MRSVFVIGAGPAGLFAAQKIALAGHRVFVFNRDIKPGGLAEYGIYPVKHKMKAGLRRQFEKVLSHPHVHYFGHVPIGRRHAVTLEELRELGPAALVFAVGAQGTKKLGLPGETASGVYSAKDFVYHYNVLPPFASNDFSCGKRVAIVGMGNVMVDIARWLLQDSPARNTEEVIVVARRGPFEAKFDDKEFEHIAPHLDRKLFSEELSRISSRLSAAGQDVTRVYDETFAVLRKQPPAADLLPRLSFRFLCSPKQIHAGPDGRINRLTVSENELSTRDGSVSAIATGETSDLDVDTMIFAIGDTHDPSIGLPCGPQGYMTRIDASDPARPAYEVFDPNRNGVMEGTYVVGWARRASDGLVGIARHDAEVGAAHVLQYLERTPETISQISEKDILMRLKQKNLEVVKRDDLPYLATAEEEKAREYGVPSFKFADDTTMLHAIEQQKIRRTHCSQAA